MSISLGSGSIADHMDLLIRRGLVTSPVARDRHNCSMVVTCFKSLGACASPSLYGRQLADPLP
jgi:predicted transcriptional regulator